VANRQILSEVLLALFIILFIIFLPVLRGLQRRYRIRIWVKSFTASREARKHKQLSEARRLLEAALKTAGRLPRHWKMRAFTYDEFAALCIAEGKYPEAEQFKRSSLLLREKFDGPRAPETVIATSSSLRCWTRQGNPPRLSLCTATPLKRSKNFPASQSKHPMR
jgi:hypothetical protein